MRNFLKPKIDESSFLMIGNWKISRFRWFMSQFDEKFKRTKKPAGREIRQTEKKIHPKNKC